MIMTLSKESTVDRIEVVGDECLIQVRTVERILEDGTVISEAYHRHVVNPGDDVSNEDPKVQAVAAALWPSD